MVDFFIKNFVMNRLFFFIFLFLLPNFCCSEALVVKLQRDCAFVPVHLVDWAVVGDFFSEEYLAQLKDILIFDLENSGRVELTDSGATTQIQVKVIDRKIALKVQSLFGEHSTAPLFFTGSLAQDRQTIHRIADALHLYLFKKKGIATTQVIYTVKNGEKSDLWVSDYDGENAWQVLDDKGYIVTPCFVPSEVGKKSRNSFFASYRTGHSKIYLTNFEFGNVTRLSSLLGNQLMPAISPKRDMIAFISDVTGRPDLFIQKFDPKSGLKGKPRQIYTAIGATQGSPSFSPDGKEIAFVSNQDGVPRIYTMKIPSPGTPLKKIFPCVITRLHSESTSPSWSPDGKKLVYAARIEGIRQICLYDFETASEKQLTHGLQHKENPSWAPDSFHLVYNSQGQLYVINFNQSKPIQITKGLGEKRFPSWNSCIFE